MNDFRWIQHMYNIRDRVEHADRRHPEGARYRDLLSECDEVRDAIRNGDNKHTIYELYDVITVATRMIRQLEDQNPVKPAR